jgi:alkylhydroperoxidase family enzyme
MAWIRTDFDPAAEPRLAARLAAHADPATGRVDHILKVHALKPESLVAHLALYLSAMRGTPGLSGRDRELIALVVSSLNGCHY